MPMKKNLAKTAALLSALLLTLCLSACSMGLNEMLIVKRAYRQVADMDSLSFTVDADLDAQLASVPIRAGLDGDCSCIIDPGTLYMDMSIDMGKLGKLELPIYLFAQDDALHLRIGLGGEEEALWFSSSLPLSNGKSQDKAVDVETVLTLLQDDPEALSIGDSETVNGVLCRPFILKIPGALLTDALSTADPEGGSSVEDLVLTIWIAEEEGSPVRLSADLASLLQYLLDNSHAPLVSQLKIKTLPTTVDITGFNDVESIKLPQAG